MKKLFLVFLSLLFAVIADARLGENVSQIMMTHPSFKLIGKATIDKRAYVLVFSNGNMEVGTVFLDDKCVEEIASMSDGSELNWDEINEYMMKYDFSWEKLTHPDAAQSCAVSTNGKYYAVFGPAPYLGNKLAFRIFTNGWRLYCKAHQVTLSGVTKL